MPSWITYALLACFLVLPALLAFVGDEGPDNSITHESGDGEAEDDGEPGGLLVAA